jgi:hypothetical protein
MEVLWSVQILQLKCKFFRVSKDGIHGLYCHFISTSTFSLHAAPAGNEKSLNEGNLSQISRRLMETKSKRRQDFRMSSWRQQQMIHRRRSKINFTSVFWLPEKCRQVGDRGCERKKKKKFRSTIGQYRRHESTNQNGFKMIDLLQAGKRRSRTQTNPPRN